MKALCGANCAACQWNSTCPGCSDEKCFIARYIKKDGKEAYEEFKQTLISEFNSLGMPWFRGRHIMSCVFCSPNSSFAN